MDATAVTAYLKSIESRKRSYSNLLEYDYIFEIKGKRLDDNNLIIACWDLDTDNINGRIKLRGAQDSHPRLADSSNDSEWFHGYVYLINEQHIQAFEKDLTMCILKHNITVRKFTIGLIHTAARLRQEEHFNSLFEVA